MKKGEVMIKKLMVVKVDPELESEVQLIVDGAEECKIAEVVPIIIKTKLTKSMHLIFDELWYYKLYI